MIVNRRHPLSKRTSNRVQNAAKEATIYLYDEIGFWGINAQQFVQELNDLTADTIHLRIDSPGGDVFAARAMQTALKQHKAKVIVHIDGLAASAASFIAMAGDEIEMVDGGFMMIHKALSFLDVFGSFNKDDIDTLVSAMGKECQLLTKVDEAIANDYAKKCGKTPDEAIGWMTAESWFTAAEALSLGLIDTIYDGKPVENKYDLSIFAKTPDTLKQQSEGITKRAIERALRDAGCSQNAAKAILAGGWSEPNTQRDVEPVAPEPQREVDSQKKDRTASLLIRAEMIAPTR